VVTRQIRAAGRHGKGQAKADQIVRGIADNALVQIPDLDQTVERGGDILFFEPVVQEA
jgi:hypothetical protein